MLKIYTDGSCIGNPGPGSRGFIVFQDEKEIAHQRGDVGHTTNNQMELQAIISALQRIQDTVFTTEDIMIITDSEYVYKGVNEYLVARKARKRKLANKKPVKNLAQWKELDNLLLVFPKLQRKWVRGHADDKRNNQVDRMIRNIAV